MCKINEGFSMSVNFNSASGGNLNSVNSKNNLNFKGKNSNSTVIQKAYNITNEVPKSEKIISAGDFGLPVLFTLPQARIVTDRYLQKMQRKAAKFASGTSAWAKNKYKKFSDKVTKAKDAIAKGVNIQVVDLFKDPKNAFKEYGGIFLVGMNLLMEGMEVKSTNDELGGKAATKQAFRGIANALLATTGWVAGSAIAHKGAAKIGKAILNLLPGGKGRFLGTVVGSFLGFLGGVVGERILRKTGEFVYGKSELTQHKEKQVKNDLNNIALNDKTTIKNQIIKNQLWLSNNVGPSGEIAGLGKKKRMADAQIVMAATEELMQKYKMLGGTVEEIQMALENPEEALAQTAPSPQETTVAPNNQVVMNPTTYYSGGYNSSTGFSPNSPNFQSYPQRVFV